MSTLDYTRGNAGGLHADLQSIVKPYIPQSLGSYAAQGNTEFLLIKATCSWLYGFRAANSLLVSVSSNVTHSSVYRAHERGERLLLPSPIVDCQGNHLQVSMVPQHTTADSLVSNTSMHSMQRLATSSRDGHTSTGFEVW